MGRASISISKAQLILNNSIYKQDFTIHLNENKRRFIVSVRRLYTGTNPSNDPDLRSKISKIIDSEQFCSIGGWTNPEDGTYHLDANIHIDSLEYAMMAGTNNNQKSIFDLATGEVIVL